MSISEPGLGPVLRAESRPEASPELVVVDVAEGAVASRVVAWAEDAFAEPDQSVLCHCMDRLTPNTKDRLIQVLGHAMAGAYAGEQYGRSLDVPTSLTTVAGLTIDAMVGVLSAERRYNAIADGDANALMEDDLTQGIGVAAGALIGVASGSTDGRLRGLFIARALTGAVTGSGLSTLLSSEFLRGLIVPE